MNGAPTNSGPLRMAGRAENTTVDIYHQPAGSPEFAKGRKKICTLPDVPERLGMVQWDDAVVLRRIAVPSRTIMKIGPQECRNFSNGVADEACGKDIPNHHIPIGME